MLVSNLSVEDFQKFRRILVYSGVSGRKGLGVHALNRSITVIRGMFKYAYEIDLIDRPVKFGKAFERPSAALRSTVESALPFLPRHCASSPPGDDLRVASHPLAGGSCSAWKQRTYATVVVCW